MAKLMLRFIDTPARWVLFLAICLGLTFFWLVTHGWPDLTAEGKPVENASSILLGFVVLMAGLQFGRTRSKIWASAALAAFWLYLRELDYQRQFTPRSIESLGFYFSPAIPLKMKLITIAALLPFMTAGLHLLITARTAIPQAFRTGQVWVGYLLLAAGLVLLALLSEKVIKEPTNIVEEVSELTFAVFILLLVRHFSRVRPPETSSEPTTLSTPLAQRPPSTNLNAA